MPLDSAADAAGCLAAGHDRPGPVTAGTRRDAVAALDVAARAPVRRRAHGLGRRSPRAGARRDAHQRLALLPRRVRRPARAGRAKRRREARRRQPRAPGEGRVRRRPGRGALWPRRRHPCLRRADGRDARGVRAQERVRAGDRHARRPVASPRDRARPPERLAARGVRVRDAAGRAAGRGRRAGGPGERVRLYVPFGDDWWPYAARRVGEHPRSAVMLARALLSWRESELSRRP